MSELRDCEYCPLSWEERGLEDADVGCYRYGDLYGYKIICHMPNSIKRFIARLYIRRNEKKLCEQYDAVGEHFLEQKRKEAAMRQALKETMFINQYDEKLYLCTEHDGKMYKYNDGVMDEVQIFDVLHRYEELLEVRENDKSRITKVGKTDIIQH